MWLVYDAFPIAAPSKPQIFGKLSYFLKIISRLIIGAFSICPVEIRCNAPLVLAAIAAAPSIRDNTARLSPPLCIQSVLFGDAPERFPDFNRQTCTDTLINELRSQRLETRMA